VLIYFDQETKAAIFERMARMIEPDGVLALGAAESVVGITDAFKPYPDRRGMYCLNTARAAPRGVAGASAMPLKLVAAAR
jgi:chemotaxis protein methyltransferase CheR